MPHRATLNKKGSTAAPQNIQTTASAYIVFRVATTGPQTSYAGTVPTIGPFRAGSQAEPLHPRPPPKPPPIFPPAPSSAARNPPGQAPPAHRAKATHRRASKQRHQTAPPTPPRPPPPLSRAIS